MRPTGVAVDGQATVGGEDGDSVGVGGGIDKDNVSLKNKRRTSPSLTLSVLPSFYVVLCAIWYRQKMSGKSPTPGGRSPVMGGKNRLIWKL